MLSMHRGGKLVIEQLATYAAAESFERLLADAVRDARLATLDTLGVALAGSVLTVERVASVWSAVRVPDVGELARLMTASAR
jgi:2-methylcitrate dehydratase PrpD